MKGHLAVYLDLVRHGSFRSLLVSKLATRMARDALLYALLIRLVQETSSTRYTALFVLVYTIPSVLFGLAAGAAAESSALRPLLLAGHLGRAVLIGAMLAFGSGVWWVYAMLVLFATIGQFVGPAEASALPRMVEPEKRSAAHALVAIVGMFGTVLGAATVGPILFRLVGWRTVVAMAALLHVLAALLVLGISTPNAPRQARASAPTIRATLLHGWHALRASPDALLAFGYLTIASAMAKVVVALAPYYTKDVLGIRAENAVYIAAPGALGSLVALAVTPILARALGLSRTVGFGFFVLILGMFSAGVLVYGSDVVLNHVDIHVTYIEDEVGPSTLIVITMIMAVLIGLGGMILGIAASTTMNEEVPAASQARVASTISTVSDAASLVPLFGVAAVANLVGVRAVLLLVAAGGLAVALVLRSSRREMAPLELGPEDAYPRMG